MLTHVLEVANQNIKINLQGNRTDGNYCGGKHSIMYKCVRFLSCTPATNVTLYINNSQKNLLTLFTLCSPDFYKFTGLIFLVEGKFSGPAQANANEQ